MFLCHSRYLRPFAFFALSFLAFAAVAQPGQASVQEALMLALMGLDPAIGYP